MYFKEDIILKIVFTLLFILIVYLSKRFIVFSINRRIRDINTRHSYRKLSLYVLTMVTIFILGFIWIRKVNLGMVFSIIGAGIVIALGDFILSFFGWIFIIIRRPFELGERVQIGKIKGDVIDIRAFYITLLEIGDWVEEEQSTGRIVHIPNNFIFRNPIYNYTRSFNFIWNEIKLTITFESDYIKAKKICLAYLEEYHNSWAKDLEEKIKQAQNIYAIYYTKLTPMVYLKIVDNGVLLSLRYLVEPHQRRSSENCLAENILSAFNQNEDINFAYPTYRLVK